MNCGKLKIGRNQFFKREFSFLNEKNSNLDEMLEAKGFSQNWFVSDRNKIKWQNLILQRPDKDGKKSRSKNIFQSIRFAKKVFTKFMMRPFFIYHDAMRTFLKKHRIMRHLILSLKRRCRRRSYDPSRVLKHNRPFSTLSRLTPMCI